MNDLAILATAVLFSAVGFYWGFRLARRKPREYLEDSMRIRQIDASACAPGQNGVCYYGQRKFAVRDGDTMTADPDYVYFHEIAHQAVADRCDPDMQGAEAMADIVAWLLCRHTGAGNNLDASYSASPTPCEVLLTLGEISTAFQIADHLFALLQQGGLKVQSTNRKE